MASPQVENGHLKLANEIVEVIARTNLSPYETRILFALWRKTYGWNKKNDVISISQIVSMTSIHKSHVCHALNRLIKRNIVVKIGVARTGNKLQFQKDYTRWIELPKQATVARTGNTVARTGNKLLRVQAHTKDTIKDTKTKDRERSLSSRQEYLDNPPTEDILTLMGASSASEEQIRAKASALKDYCESHGRRYKNYAAFLRNAVKSDYPKNLEANSITIR